MKVTVRSDPFPSVIVNVQDDESILTHTLNKREVIEQLWMLNSKVVLVNSPWNESVEVEHHANAAFMVHTMEVESDTIKEVDVEPHRILIHTFNGYEVVPRNNCIGEEDKKIVGVLEWESFHGSKQVNL